jgi:hypothetical protein
MSSKCKKTFVQNVNTDLPPFDSKSEGGGCIAGNWSIGIIHICTTPTPQHLPLKSIEKTIKNINKNQKIWEKLKIWVFVWNLLSSGGGRAFVSKETCKL